ncbi:MAG TPA: hypothetical protein VFD05_00955 [Bacilli bacterium]|nr:hypothetical protein [Bacilli bacterium]
MREIIKRIEEVQEELEHGNSVNLAEFKALLEKLLAANHSYAYETLGYAYYLGYPSYERDYVKAEEAFLRSFELAEDPFVANTLGYIYYYGRASGVPDYAKARKYFMIGAKDGVIESLYKLADLDYKGLGGPKNIGRALELYHGLYLDNFHRFITGNHAKFADLALRQARLNLEDDNFDECEALRYYLAAKYALELRQDVNYVGDKNLYTSVLANIEELNQKLKITVPQELPHEVTFNFNRDVRHFVAGDYGVKIYLANRNGQTLLKVESTTNKAFLITVPSLNFVTKCQTFEIIVDTPYEETPFDYFNLITVDDVKQEVFISTREGGFTTFNYHTMKIKL